MKLGTLLILMLAIAYTVYSVLKQEYLEVLFAASIGLVALYLLVVAKKDE